jgi:hypothetical protein
MFLGCYLPYLRYFGSCQNASIFCQYMLFVGQPRLRFSAPVVPTDVVVNQRGQGVG